MTVRRSTALSSRRLRASKQQNVFDGLAQAVDALNHGADNLAFAHVAWKPGSQDLQRAAQTGEGVADFVRDDGGKLTELRQRCLLAQPGFD